MTKTVQVALGDRTYNVLIDADLLPHAGKHILPLLKRPRVIIITDEIVAPLYLAALQQSLEKSGVRHQHIMLPAGEQTKNITSFMQLMEQLLDLRPDRQTSLIALGGGVIGDITGFAASVLLRGVDFIQIPTTLLAQVDSSVGGKTGINTRHGKNLIGTFYQPRLVLADTGVLHTLPKRELLAGYAEVVKYGVINNYPFFAWLEEHSEPALAGDKEALAHMVCESCHAKAAIVAQDEREAGARALLNFGHTFGHALEVELGFDGRLLHGEAVSIGMVMALEFSVMLGMCEPEDAARIKKHLSAVGAPISARQIHKEWDIEKLITHCYQDKKSTNGKLTFILAEKIGKAVVNPNVDETALRSALTYMLVS